MMKYQTIILLIVITLLAFALRFINIDSAPPGFNWDEAALGYNAYSILKTGRDEYGEVLPIIFKSFGDYKPGLYVYLAVPFIALFGLNELAVRFPSILIGCLIPLLGYLITRQLLPQEKKYLGLLTAFFLAISPWAIHFSRGAWETNVSFFEILLGVLFFLKAREGSKLFLILSFIFFGLSLYTYQSAKILAIGLSLGLVFIYRKHFLYTKKRFLTIGLLISLFAVLITTFLNGDASSRLSVLNQYNYKRSEQELNAIRKEEETLNNFTFSLFHSEDLEYLRIVTSRYLNYFSPNFLFISSSLDGRQGALGYGAMHLLEAPFFLLGLFTLFRKLLKEGKVILLMSLLSPLPSALSRDSINTVRVLPLSFSLEFFTALGVYAFLTYFKKLFIPVTLFILVLEQPP